MRLRQLVGGHRLGARWRCRAGDARGELLLGGRRVGRRCLRGRGRGGLVLRGLHLLYRAGDVEAARFKLVIEREGHAHSPAQGVALVAGVADDHVAEFFRQGHTPLLGNREKSLAENSAVKLLGAIVRPEETEKALLSISVRSLFAISTGSKVPPLLKVPRTAFSRPCSSLSMNPMLASFNTKLRAHRAVFCGCSS